MPLLQRLKNLFGVTDDDIRADETTIQRRYAGKLRATAIHQLRFGQGIVGKAFRGEYLASGLGNYEPFLRQQERNGTWGTYIEATALAEAVGCHLVVTPVKGGTKQDPIGLYRAADPSAPTIHLYNSNNTHWYVNSNTLGDGNCLHNAFAQALQQKAKEELRFENTAPVVPSVVKASVFARPSVEAHHDVIEQQRSIAAAVNRLPTPVEVETQLVAERTRIQKLPPERQAEVTKQIAADYQLALQLAREEMQYVSPRAVFSSMRCGTANTFGREASRHQQSSPAIRI